MKIAYITERDINSKQISGAITRDIRLLEILNSFSTVDIYFNDPTIYHKYLYIINNNQTNESLFEEINSKDYDLVIISLMMNSPFLNAYNIIHHKSLYYIGDSSFHINSQKLTIKYKIMSYIYKIKEKRFLKKNMCAYLGKDEIKFIPKKYRKNCIQFPFFVDINKNLFNNNGKLILVGDYNFKPNYVMLKNMSKVADKIKNDIYVYGKNIPKQDYPSNIKIIGYADTLDEIYQDARALLYPVSYGTGIKNKVLEAMSYGIPTIGYKEAFTNLNLINKESCLKIKDMKELIEITNNYDLTSVSSCVYYTTKKEYSKSKITAYIQENIENYIRNKDYV